MSAESPQPSSEHNPQEDLDISDETLKGLASFKEPEQVELEDGTSLEIQPEELGGHILITVTSLEDVDGAEYIGALIGTIYMDPEKLEDAVVDLPDSEELGTILEKLSAKRA